MKLLNCVVQYIIKFEPLQSIKMSESEPEFQLQEVSCMKAVTLDQFSQGLQEYPFSIGRPNAFLPSQSYFRIRLSLTGANGTQPTMAQKLAFADNAVGNMFSNVYFRAGGQDVSSLVSYVPQAGQMKNRINKTWAWTNSIGKAAFMINPSFNDRCRLTSIGSFSPLGDSNSVSVGVTGTTIAITAVSGAVAGIDSLLTNLDVGDTLVVNGVPYTITARTSNTAATVTPPPLANVAATAQCYGIKSDPTQTQNGKNDIYVIWRPPIGIMDVSEMLGAGDYRFSLNPNSDFQKSAVQSTAALNVGVAPATPGIFNVSVMDIKLYVATVKASIPDQVQNLYLREIDVQSKSIIQGNNSLQFTIPPSTRYISVFTQANASGANTMYPPSLFTTVNGDEKSMTSLQLTYANQVKPSTRWDSNFTNTVGGRQNQWQQRYVDNLREANLLDSDGGAEDYQQFLERGVFVHYSFGRDESDKSTQAQLSLNYAGEFTGTPTKVFLVSHYTRAVELTTSNGVIVSVRTLTV